MERGLPWAKLDREISDVEIRKTVVGRILRNEPHQLGGGWKQYTVERRGESPIRIFANPRRQIVVLFNEARNPSPDQFKKITLRLNDLRLTFEPPLGRVMGDWEIWSTDNSFIKNSEPHDSTDSHR